MVKLVYGVKGLELTAGAHIQCRKIHCSVHQGNRLFGSAVPIGINGKNFLIPAEEDIIHPPGINGQTVNLRKNRFGLGNALFHMGKQCLGVPGKAVFLRAHSVGKTVHLPGLDDTVLPPAHNMSAGGSADINGQIVTQKSTSFFPLCL